MNQNDEVHLNCTADGLPAPTIFWTRLSNNSHVSMPLNIRGQKDQGGYRCTAYNGVGDPDTADVFITVQSKSNSFLFRKLEKSLGVENPAAGSAQPIHRLSTKRVFNSLVGLDPF